MEESTLSPIEKHVIETVKNKRIEKGWSQKELAFETDLSLGFIGDVENPRYRAKYNLNHINIIAKAFGCSPRELLPESPL